MTLRIVINLIISGTLPTEAVYYLGSASLTALKKPSSNPGDVRPIAVGNVIRRIAVKCACSIIKDKARRHLAPHQLGVAVPSGSDKIIHNEWNCN